MFGGNLLLGNKYERRTLVGKQSRVSAPLPSVCSCGDSRAWARGSLRFLIKQSASLGCKEDDGKGFCAVSLKGC